MHIEPKTGRWIETLLAGGAKNITLVGCAGTTMPDTAAYLASLDNVTVLGKRADSIADIEGYIARALEQPFDVFLDNGGSVNTVFYEKARGWLPIGSTEETMSGRLAISRLDRAIPYPILVIDDSPVKKTLENTIGVGQSVVDGFMRCTSLLVGGKRVLVIGYGWCGKGIAACFKGLGAVTSSYDQDPLKQLEARMHGHMTNSLEVLLREADVVVTATGSSSVISTKELSYLKSGAILCNAGHFGTEIDIPALQQASRSVTPVAKQINKYDLPNKSLFLLADGHPINLAAGDGNPIEIMDLGLGLQLLSAEALCSRRGDLTPGLQALPNAIDAEIAELTLRRMA
jgi:adenosylhomocysteinase